MQEKYWRLMVQVKASIFYLDKYVESSYVCERRINMYGAIVSSSSIGLWAVWREFSMLWAVLIAGSQVCTAIKEFLPFSRRIKIIIPFIEDLKILFNKIEYNWFRVASGELTEKEINDLLFELKREYTEIENKHMKDATLIENINYIDEAAQKNDLYFQNNF